MDMITCPECRQPTAMYDDYRINCLRGASSVPCVYMCWATSALDAFEQARRAGYTPVSLS